MDFRRFFHDVARSAPYPWQERFAEADPLPDLVVVPTGGGKTAGTILGWLWRRWHGPEALRASTPRRLVFCLPMRTLVEQTEREARAWLARSGMSGDEVSVHALLGGAVDDAWESHPERDALLIGTQDQLLSRALHRGFAMSRYRWPIHFALLNNDCLWVLDEVQLMGVGLSTSAQLQAFRNRTGTFGPSRSVWMSATLDAGRLRTVDHRDRPLVSLEVSDADRADPRLAARLNARKPLSLAATAYSGDLARYARDLAGEVLGAHREGSRTLVVLNRVARAQAVFRQVQKAARGTNVALVHARFRPPDRRAAQATALEDGWTGILIATQAVEAGVDLSARTLFTELAPWSSLVQRFGRCNRGGEWAEGEADVRWIDLEGEGDESALPYARSDLDPARERLSALPDVGPQALAEVPETAPQPPADPVLRRRDLNDLFDTQPDLAGFDLDVSRFVRDAGVSDVQVAWRTFDPDAGPPAEAPLLHRDELCALPLPALRDLVRRSRTRCWRFSGLTGSWEPVWHPVPGMALVLPAEAGGYSPVLGFTGDPKDLPAGVDAAHIAPDADEREPLTHGCADYVTLATHASDVAGEMERLRERLGGGLPWEDLLAAARWHDLGKVHPAFQEMLVSGLADGDPRRTGGPWAKSDRQPDDPRPFQRCARASFRHELASALALLQQGGNDLQAYLVAAHHGKVRVSIRPRPGEPSPPGDRRSALGVWEGDRLPAADLGDGIRSEAVELDLRPMELGQGVDGAPSWLARVLALVEDHGGFKLAFLETLVRVADWRGTALRGRPGGEELARG